MPVISRLRRIRDDEQGMTLIELLVATSAGMILFMGLTMAVLASMHNMSRVSNRVQSTEDARTALHRVTSELHSSCVARYLTPIMPESSASELRFVRSISSEVSPTPVESRVFLSGTTLKQADYEVLSGSSPEWKFKSTPYTSSAIMSGVAPISGSVPLFRYYAFTSGVLSTTPLAPPTGKLTEKEGESVVKVDLALKVVPPGGPVTDAKGAAQVQDSAYLRFTPPQYSTSSTSNLPCE
jgi:type II secretory pathway pseudopilin PulG